MSMKRTPEWYAEYQARRIKQIGKITSGGPRAVGDAEHMQGAAGSPYGLTAAGECIGGSAPVGESGPLTNIEFIAGGERPSELLIHAESAPGLPNTARRGSGRGVSPSPAPIYPVVQLCRAAGLPEPIPEYQFHPRRKWRADYAWPAHKLMLEIDGGVWTQGRHTRGSGRILDMEKQSEAAILGWRILYVTPEQVSNGAALDYMQRALRPLEFVA